MAIQELPEITTEEQKADLEMPSPPEKSNSDLVGDSAQINEVTIPDELTQEEQAIGVELTDTEEIRSNEKQKRCVSRDNVQAVLDALLTPKFKALSSFRRDIYILLEEIDVCCSPEKARITEIEGYEYINTDMKNKNKDLYKKLMTKIYDSDPKQKKYQNVKIKKSLIKQLEKEFNVENPIIEDLIHFVLTHYLSIRQDQNKK